VVVLSLLENNDYSMRKPKLETATRLQVIDAMKRNTAIVRYSFSKILCTLGTCTELWS
jgi:hypothetical protein